MANTTREERKQKAIEILRQLDIYSPYINGFKAKAQKVCEFENFGGFWVQGQNSLLEEKIKELEEKYNCTIYAITHSFTEFGELYDFLLVTDYKEEWSNLVGAIGNNKHYAFAYCWNKDNEDYSEFGDIAVQSCGGGIKRIG